MMLKVRILFIIFITGLSFLRTSINAQENLPVRPLIKQATTEYIVFLLNSAKRLYEQSAMLITL